MPIPFQTPAVPLSGEPRRAVPATVGLAVLTGGELGTAAVAVLAAVATPSGFEAMTSTRIEVPTSAAPSVYVASVAPGMSTTPRCH